MTTPAQYELYRVILDYEALQDGFADRIEELNVTLTEIDAAAGMTRGQTQKLLRKLGADDFRPSAQRKYSRGFAWETLGKTLKGTGLALALIVDDERFAPVKAEMANRERPARQAKPLSKAVLKQIIAGTFASHGRMGGLLRSRTLSPSQRKKIAKAGARARWRKNSRK